MAGRVLACYHSLNITADKTEPRADISGMEVEDSR
jgi:hypothetical protein